MELCGFDEALALTLEGIEPLGTERIDLSDATGRVLASEVRALVDSPSLDASLKDGYAVRSGDVEGARAESPRTLKVMGEAAAGSPGTGSVGYGTAIRITTGAPIPDGADAVVAGEFCKEEQGLVYISLDAGPGRNILSRGTDIRAGGVVLSRGEELGPAHLGLLAGAGIQTVEVVRRPRVAIVATGDEVVAPGGALEPGKLFASNLVTISSWLQSFGIGEVRTEIVGDSEDVLAGSLRRLRDGADALLTSGGAWTSRKDLVVGLFDRLGWRKVYHRVRMGPGKAVAFGLWDGRPTFCLPGGPPSNEMAFLQLALPGILKMAGVRRMPFATMHARLVREVRGRDRRWTQFVHALLSRNGEELQVTPHRPASRLRSMAEVEALIKVPEGVDGIEAGSVVPVQVLRPGALAAPLPAV